MKCIRSASFAIAALLVPLTGAIHGEGTKTRTDLYGDPLPPGAVARLGTIRLRHLGAEMAFSADGKRLISCDDEGEVRVWDVATGKRVGKKRLSWGSEPGQLGNVTLSPDGAMAALWDGVILHLCDTNTGKKWGRLPFDNIVGGFLLVQTFSPDSKLLAVQTYGEGRTFNIRIWDVAAIKRRQTLKTPPDIRLSCVSFSGDGKRLAGIAEKGDGSGKLGAVLFDLFLWDVTTGKLIAKREDLRRMNADALAFSPNGKTLAVGERDEQGVWLLEADTLKEKTRLKPPGNAFLDTIDHLAFSPNGRWLAAAYDAVPLAPFQYGVLVWDLSGTKEPRRLPARYGSKLAFAPDGKTLACKDSAGSEIRLYDTASGRALHQRPGHDRPVRVLAASPDGQIIASVDSDSIVRLWDAATSKQLRMIEQQTCKITACLFTPDGKRVVVIGDMVGSFGRNIEFQVWDAEADKCLRHVESEEGVPLYAAAVSGDGKRLAAVLRSEKVDAEGKLVVWDLVTGKRLSQRPYQFEVRVDPKEKNPPRIAVHAAFAADGERMTEWRGDRVGIEEVSTGCLLATLPKGAGRPLVFSPDGRLLAAAIRQPNSDDPLYHELKGLSLIKAASGEEVLRLEVKELDDIVFTPDGRGVVVVDSAGLYVWDTATGAKLHQRTWPERLARTVNDPGDRILVSLAALPGDRVATGMEEGDILVWDLAASTWPVRKPVSDLSPEKLAALWSDLAGDARKAHRVVYQMAAAPAQAVSFLKDHLRPAAVDAKSIEKLLADLDGDSFTVREAAVRELTRLHYRVEPMLRRALEGKPSLELRRRVQAILAGPKKPLAEDLRTLRAIAVLERIGTPEAQRILEKLAEGAACRETQEAQAALQRLKRR
jgi:WD40 repeat protein